MLIIHLPLDLQSIILADLGVEEGGFADNTFLVFVVDADQSEAGPKSLVPFKVVEE